jgi:hypothetical protein
MNKRVPEMVESEMLICCSICMETYNDSDRTPRVLSCGHSFCQETIQQLVKSDKVQCPKCRATTKLIDGSVTSLPKNFDFLDALEVLAMKKQVESKEVPKCHECNENEAKLSCPHCENGVVLCEACDRALHQFKTLKSHVRKRLSNGNVSIDSTPMCDTHSSKLVELFCKTDDQFVCTLCCLIGAHKGHEFSALEEAEIAISQELKEMTGNITEMNSNLDGLSASMMKAQRGIQESSEASLKLIEETFSNIRNQVNTRETVLKQQTVVLAKQTLQDIERKRELTGKVHNEFVIALQELQKMESISLFKKMKLMTTLKKNQDAYEKLIEALPPKQSSEIKFVALGLSELKLNQIGLLSCEEKVELPLSVGFSSNATNLLVSPGSNVSLLSNGEVNEFKRIVVKSGAVLTTSGWDGSKGGFLRLKAREVIVERGGKIAMSGKGYRGGGGQGSVEGIGMQGESSTGPGSSSVQPNSTGGGGGIGSGNYGSAGGGGGGDKTMGTDADINKHQGKLNSGGIGGRSTMERGCRGGGGGSGFAYSSGANPKGGNGGGVVWIEAKMVKVEGTIECNGASGENGVPQHHSGAGGGAGGSVVILAKSVEGAHNLQVSGGNGGERSPSQSSPETSSKGGNGGQGWIVINEELREVKE